jgi:O-antigen ligase
VLVVASVVSLVWYLSYGNALDVALPNARALQLSSRVEIWSRAILAIADFPLTGVSVNGFRQVIQVLYPTFLVGPDIDLGHAHNQLLQAALDLGLPGLVGYLSLWFLSAGMVIRNLQRLLHLGAEQHPYYTLTVALSGSLVAGWIFGLLDAISLGARPSFVWWLIIALSGGVHYLVMYEPQTFGRRRRRLAAEDEAPVYDTPLPVLGPPLREPEPRPASRPRMRYRPPSDA